MFGSLNGDVSRRPLASGVHGDLLEPCFEIRRVAHFKSEHTISLHECLEGLVPARSRGPVVFVNEVGIWPPPGRVDANRPRRAVVLRRLIAGELVRIEIEERKTSFHAIWEPSSRGWISLPKVSVIHTPLNPCRSHAARISRGIRRNGGCAGDVFERPIPLTTTIPEVFEDEREHLLSQTDDALVIAVHGDLGWRRKMPGLLPPPLGKLREQRGKIRATLLACSAGYSSRRTQMGRSVIVHQATILWHPGHSGRSPIASRGVLDGNGPRLSSARGVDAPVPPPR